MHTPGEKIPTYPVRGGTSPAEINTPHNLKIKPWHFNILLVEDNMDDREQIVRTLRRADYIYKILCFDSGNRFLSFLSTRDYGLFKASSDRPMLIFLDIHMPGLSGLKVLRDLKENPETCTLPVIITTTDLSPSQVQEAYDLKANAYMPKPVQLDNLYTLIYNGWGALQENPPTPYGMGLSPSMQ
jgi:CheY-like chemotaxis protein